MNTKYRESSAVHFDGMSFGGGISMRFAAFSGCLFLLLLVFLAAPVQSQDPTPAPFQCGASVTPDTGTILVMSADCDNSATRITIGSGRVVTLNGNGYTISGATGNPVFRVQNANTVFNLNDITISSSGTNNGDLILVNSGATLNARNVIFSGNAGMSLTFNDANTRGTLTNVQFLNNGPSSTSNNNGSVLTVRNANVEVTINGATFSGNSGNRPSAIYVRNGILNLNGCIRASGNTGVDGAAVLLYAKAASVGVINDTSSCPKPKKEKKTATATATATQRPLAVTCPTLSQATGIVIHAAYGLDSGIQCQRLDGGGIGVQALAENHIAAVDIWGYVEQGVEVCFPRTGRIIFLDARMSPRSMMPLPTRISGDMTCATIDGPGSLVLLPPE